MDAEFGIAFQTDKPPGAYGPLAAAAETHGFDVVSVFADLLYQPPLPALLEMARATSRVRLGAIGITQSRPLRRLREAAAVARALLAGDETGFAGQEFRLEPGTRLRAVLPSRVPPLLLGAWGPRGTALAGQI